VAFAHLPAVAWAVYIEASAGICPLTPLENDLRSRAGLDPYSGDFVARYVFPALYPEGLTARVQLLLGLLVFVLNVAAYGWIVWRLRRRPSIGGRVGVNEPQH
jgi:hypothetical protein